MNECMYVSNTHYAHTCMNACMHVFMYVCIPTQCFYLVNVLSLLARCFAVASRAQYLYLVNLLSLLVRRTGPCIPASWSCHLRMAREDNLQIRCVFSYHRMCSLTIECVLLLSICRSGVCAVLGERGDRKGGRQGEREVVERGGWRGGERKGGREKDRQREKEPQREKENKEPEK